MFTPKTNTLDFRSHQRHATKIDFGPPKSLDNKPGFKSWRKMASQTPFELEPPIKV